jgi:DNA (cytosine-5)-methyltransferase 1
MENVPNVIGRKNIKDFQLWETKLEHLGYMNFVQILNAKDYGIPQNRARCFMVSIHGKYNYEFPKKEELKLRLKDFLDNEVDEKYFLSEKMLETVLKGGTKNWFMKPEIDLNIARPLTATMHKMHRAGCDNYVSENYIKNDRKYFLIPEATKKGFQVACDGDGVYINRPHQKRGTVQKGMIQTIKTEPDIGTVVEDKNFANKPGGKGIRIRKLTPCEAWRLMGFTDIDFEKAKKVNSDTQLYKHPGLGSDYRADAMRGIRNAQRTDCM